MSKNLKKLLSVVLAVIVLAAGFSTTLGALKPVSADQTTVDYTTVISAITSSASTEKGILTEMGQTLPGSYALVTEDFKIYDTMGFGTNFGDKVNGLRVFDGFFQHTNPSRVYADADREDIHPYITYKVEAGTSFSVEFLMYDVPAWEGFGHTAEMAEIDILVSSDGYNFVPAVSETRTIAARYYSAWDKKITTVENVGADTHYVRVQSRVNPTTVTYHADGRVNYYPQDALFIQKVTFTEGDYQPAATAEVKLDFSNKTATKNGETVANVKDLFVNVENVKIDFGGDYGITPTGNSYGMYKGGGWETKHAWGSIPETSRSLYLYAKSGTRFQLTWGSYNNWSTVAASLVAYNKAYKDGLEGYTDVYAEYEATADFAWKVYTLDSKTGEWTEHKMVPNVSANGTLNKMTFDFVIPEGHSYVKMVSPLTGTIGNIMKVGSDGYPMASSKENAVAAGACGNDWAQLNSISYTPCVEEKDATYYDYDDVTKFPYGSKNQGVGPANDPVSSNGDAATGSVPTAFKNVTTAVGGYHVTLDNWGNNNYGISIGYGYGALGTSGTVTNRPYIVYNAKPGSVFEAKVRIYLSTKYNAEKEQADAGLEVRPFEFYFSTSDKQLGTYTQAAKTTSVSINKGVWQYHTVRIEVPETDSFVKIEFPQTGSVGGGRANHNAFICDVNYVAYEDYYGEGAELHVYKKDEVETKVTSSSGEANFNALIGAYATKNSAFYENNVYKSWPENDVGGIGVERGGTIVNRGKAYIVYNVERGTLFTAKTYFNALYRKYYLDCGVPEFEFVFYASATPDGAWKRIAATNTTVTNGAANEEVRLMVPDYAKFIKVEFPQVCALSESAWNKDINGNGKVDIVSYGNHDAWLHRVSFVPGKEVSEFYDYKNTDHRSSNNGTSKDTALYSGDEGFNEATGAVDSSYIFLDGWTNPNTGESSKLGVWSANIDNQNIDQGGAYRSRAYLTYNVQPGSNFKATLQLAADHAAKHKETAETFRFIISASDKVDGTYVEIAQATSNANLDITVPAGKSFIKIEFPQRGAADNCKYPNHCAFIKDVTFVPFLSSVNSYANAEGTSFTDANKVDYNIYYLNNVEATADGVVAVEGKTNAYVDYKVSNSTAFEVVAIGDLKFAVSYDGVNFGDAYIENRAGVYTLNLIEGKQFVRVYLGEGDVITAVNASHLSLDATFINAAGKTETVAVAYGAIPKPTLNTNRTGYTFTKWGTDGLVEGIYTDKTYEAKYAKEDKEYNIAVENGGVIVKIGNIDCEADTTTGKAKFDDRVTIEAPALDNGAKFDKWVAYDLNGKKLGTISNSHKFSFLVSSSIVLDAEYVLEDQDKTESAPFIFNGDATVTDNNDGSWNMSVVWRVNAPADTKITETGILFAKTNLGDDAAWEAEIGGNAYKIAHSTTATNKTLMYTVNNIKVDKDERFALPYAKLENGGYIFGNVVSGTEIINYGTTINYINLVDNTNSHNFGGWNYSYLGAAAMNTTDGWLSTGTTTGLEPYFGHVQTEWQSERDEVFYIVYKVNPGTKFKATFKKASHADQYLETLGIDSFDFKISSSASKTEGFGNVVTTAGLGNDPEIIYDVPADCEYVKITFPQKGMVPGTQELNGGNGVRLNDAARLVEVKFTAE